MYAELTDMQHMYAFCYVSFMICRLQATTFLIGIVVLYIHHFIFQEWYGNIKTASKEHKLSRCLFHFIYKSRCLWKTLRFSVYPVLHIV